MLNRHRLRVTMAVDALPRLWLGILGERTAMTQITARVPDELAEVLDAVAAQLKSSRAGVIRQALESYLEDFDDLSVALHRLRDPSDPVLDWDQIKRELLSPN